MRSVGKFSLHLFQFKNREEPSSEFSHRRLDFFKDLGLKKQIFFFFFMLRLQLAVSRLRWKRWNFHWAVGAGSPCILAPHLSLLIADLPPGSHPSDLSLTWANPPLARWESSRFSSLLVLGFWVRCSLCWSKNLTGFLTMCYSSDFCYCTHIVKWQRNCIFCV